MPVIGSTPPSLACRRSSSMRADDTTLDPHAGLATAPVGERADAVARAEDVIEVVVNLIERNTEVDRCDISYAGSTSR